MDEHANGRKLDGRTDSYKAEGRASGQKIENISQYALSIPPEENIHASDVFDFVKSFKEKITKLDYNSPYSQFQNLINDLASFRENLINIINC